MIANFLIIYFAFSLVLVGICKQYNLLVDNKIEKHKKYSSNLKSYSIGGMLLIFFFEKSGMRVRLLLLEFFSESDYYVDMIFRCRF